MSLGSTHTEAAFEWQPPGAPTPDCSTLDPFQCWLQSNPRFVLGWGVPQPAGFSGFSPPTFAGGSFGLALGKDYSCQRSGGAVSCFGANPGVVLGSGSVPGLEGGVTSIGSGRDHACAFQAGLGMEGLFCWGRNDRGQVGSGRPSAVEGVTWVTGFNGGMPFQWLPPDKTPVTAIVGNGVVDVLMPQFWQAASCEAQASLDQVTAISANTCIYSAAWKCPLANLENGVAVSVRIRCDTWSTVGTWSDWLIVTPRLTRPAAVTATAGLASAHLGWPPVPNATGYAVRWATSPDLAGGGTRVDVAAPPFDHAGLTPGTTYTYQVSALSAHDESPPSSRVSAVPLAGPPAQPTVLGVVPGDHGLDLDVLGSPGDYPRSCLGEAWTDLAAAAPAAAAILDQQAPDRWVKTLAGLQNGATYWLRARCTNAVGDGPWSAWAAGTPQGPPTLPPPTGVTATGGIASVELSWDPVPGAQSYDILWSTAPGVRFGSLRGWKNVYAASSCSASRCSDAVTSCAGSPCFVDLQPGLLHYFAIVTNDDRTGTPSAEVSATPLPVPIPANPRAIGGLASVTVSWDPVPAPAGYRVYWSASPGVTPASGTRIDVAAPPLYLFPLPPGLRTFHVVTAVVNAAESAPSAEVTAVALEPPAPANPAASPGPGPSAVTLTWDPVPGAGGYHVYWSTTPGVTPASGTGVSIAGPPFVHTGLTPGQPVYYVVTSFVFAYEGPPSGEVSATPRAAAVGTVAARYPASGSGWNDYVKNDGPSRLAASDTACDPVADTGGYSSCLHGGEMRAFTADLPPACDGITAQDDAAPGGAFQWTCDASAPRLTLVSTGLREGAFLSDLVRRGTTGAPEWKPIALAVSIAGAPYTSSEPAVWWPNPVVEVVSQSQLSTAGAVYVAGTSRNAGVQGLTVTAPRVALVAEAGSGIVTLSASGLSFLWLEGSLGAANGFGQALSWSGIDHSVVRGLGAVSCFD